VSGTTALLLVDCQEDYFGRVRLHPPRDTLVEAIAAALAEARSRGWPIIHVRTRVKAGGSDAMPHRRNAPEAVEGTPGAEPPQQLREADGEPVLFKRFFSAFDAAGLEDELRSRGIGRLVIAGVHSHACIQATATDAYARGFEVAIASDLVGSYDPAHGALALEWLDGRAASVVDSPAIFGDTGRAWQHRNPCAWDEVLGEVEVQPPDAVASAAARLADIRPLPLAERTAMLRAWHQQLDSSRGLWIEALVRELGKPRIDAEGEVAYGLGLLDHVAKTLADEEEGAGRQVRYLPHGIAGLVTPWNNPFAIPVAKLAPALGFGNSAVWKPALPGSGIAAKLAASLADCGLGERIALVTGDAATGQAVIRHADLLSFTGSVGAGKQIIAAASRRGIPVQAELGGSNAAIVDASANLDAAAQDLASGMFSFAGQRCTAIRRVIVVDAVYDAFVDRLAAAARALSVGDPGDGATQVGPVLDKSRQQAFLALARPGGTILCGGDVPANVPEGGCWVAPTLLADLPPSHALLTQEVFGPLAALVRVPGLDAAIAAHNATDLGLVGALFSQDEAAKTQFLSEAQAGILSINRARPAFAAEGPFTGWKASGFGPPEHGRWNRDFYARVQAVYRD
jgi:acyl-CoA reductase-like NAD-dependent aldehyde dehydrogenase